METEILFRLGDVSQSQLALVCLVAFSVSVLSGLSGYGAGLVLPVFLAPMIGIANVVPVMAICMLFNTGSRALAFRHDLDTGQALRILIPGLPACMVGAWAYTLLSSTWIALLLGGFMLFSIPARRMMHHFNLNLSGHGVTVAGVLFGFINGGLAGTGIILISVLMAAGMQGAALIATDAFIAVILAVVKITLFSGMAKLNADLAIAGLLVGLCTAPGGFIARRLLRHIPMRIHAWVMEVVVFLGALVLIWKGI